MDDELREETARWLEENGYPRLAHAHRLTGLLILTVEARDLHDAATLAEWDAAVADYRE